MCALSDYLKRLNSIFPPNADIVVEELEEGFSNKAYKISVLGTPKWVLRIPMLDAQRFHIDRDRELRVWHSAATVGLTSQVIWNDCEGAVLSEYLNGSTYPTDVSHDDVSISKIGDAIKGLHALPAVEYRYDVQSIIQDWLRQIQQHRSFASVQKECRQLSNWFDALEFTPCPKEWVVGHNDLNPKNFIASDDSLHLIDWESVGMNDPLFDLAVIGHTHHLGETQLTSLCQSVLGKELTFQDWGRLTAYRRLYVLRELAWLLLKHVTASEELNGLEWYHYLISDADFNPYFQ